MTSETFSLYAALSARFGAGLVAHSLHKPALQVMSRAVEEAVLEADTPFLIFTGFQHRRYYAPAAARYRRIGEHAAFLGLYGQEIAHPGGAHVGSRALADDDCLRQEWFIVAESARVKMVLVYRESEIAPDVPDAARQFAGIWSFQPAVVEAATDLLVAHGFDDPTAVPEMARAAVRAQPMDWAAHYAAQQRIEGAVMQALETSTRKRQDAEAQRALLQVELRHLTDELSRSHHLLVSLLTEKAQADNRVGQAASALGDMTHLVELLTIQSALDANADLAAALRMQVERLSRIVQPGAPV